MNRLLFILLFLGKLNSAAASQAAGAASAAPPPGFWASVHIVPYFWQLPAALAANAHMASGRFADYPVYDLKCKSCDRNLTRRAMRAVQLADKKTVLYSCADLRELLDLGALQKNSRCPCEIQDIACLCTAVVGYRVSQPCQSCLSGATNGHRNIFWENAVRSSLVAIDGTEKEKVALRYLTFGDEPALWPSDYDADGNDPDKVWEPGR